MRRLNVKLTLWLVGITLFSVVGVHFLHGFQLDRNADFLRVQAEKAREAGNAREAMKQYNQYLKHRDDPQGYSALAEVVVEIANDKSATMQDKRRAYSILEEAIRRHQDLDDVRRSLIDYTIQARRYNDALEHIQYLMNKGTKDPELDFKVALCHYFNGEQDQALKKLGELLGYDPQTNAFVENRPSGADEIPAFELLSQIMRRNSDGRELANAIMLQMVAWNPEMAKAHLSRAGYLINAAEFNPNSQEFKDAKPELERAIELAPDDVDVLITVAAYSITEGAFATQQGDTAAGKADFDKAQQMLDKALASNPERQDVYLRLSQLSLSQSNVEKAIEQLKMGLAKANEVNSILERLVDLQFQQKDYEAVRATCKEMRERETIARELISYQEARLKFAEGNYVDASREFESVRPILARFGRNNYTLQLDLMLGRCYEMLNQPDRQLEVYRRVLQVSPSQAAARLGEATALQSLGRHAEAAISVNLLADNAKQFPFLQTPVMYLLINDVLQKPEAQRNWQRVDELAELILQDGTRNELDNTLLKSELLMLKNRLDEAQSLLIAAQKDHPKDPRVWMTLTKLMSRNDKTRERLPKLLDRVEKEIGDTPGVRAERIRLAARQSPEKAVEELKKIEQDLAKFPEQERISLMMLLGNSYLQARDFAGAKRCWKFVVEKDPKNASIRQTMFDLSIDTKDEDASREVVKELQDSRFFGPQSPLYKYCIATEMLTKLNRELQDRKGRLQEADQKVLADARKLIDEAIATRGEWGVLWRVRGEIEQLEGNFASAIDNYQRSLNYSRAGQAATARRLVQLLYANGRIDDANEALKYLGETGASDPLRKMVADIKDKTGHVDDALAIARKDVEEDPKNAANHVWLGQLLVRAGQSEEAEQELRKGIELNPNAPEFWDMLVRHLIASKKKNDAVATIGEASKALADDPVTVARLYERVGDKVEAEHFYKLALEKQPEDLLAIRRIVEYYLTNNESPKALPYLEQMIRKTAKSSDKLQQSYLQWARRNKAEVLASSGSYEQVMEAVQLVEQNVQADGQLGPDDMLAIVMLLSRRPEPESRDKAARMLGQLEKVRPLLPREQTALAQLYVGSGKWTEARDLMLAAISNKSDDPEILVNLANMLINHEEYEDATRWVERLEELTKPPAQTTDQIRQAVRNLRARLLVHNGEREQAVQVLESLVPSPMPQNQLFRLELVSKMMESLGLNEGAKRLLEDYMAQEPRGAIAMASFLGRTGDIDGAFALLEEARKNQPMIEILPCALEGLRNHRDQANKERFKTLESWAQSGLEGESNKQQIKLLLAEIYDLQGQYDNVVKVYRELLEDPDANDYQKALVKNNLAFVLAISKDKPGNAAEALKLVEEAIRVLGPTSDLLDTRALAYMALGKTKQAVADLQMAVTDKPSGSKYFHLALAEKQNSNPEAARTALTKAQELGTEPKQLTSLESKSFQELVDSLK
jgi:cellulose synthase operon protein C